MNGNATKAADTAIQLNSSHLNNAMQLMAVMQEALAREENLAYFAAYVRGRSGPVRGRLPP